MCVIRPWFFRAVLPNFLLLLATAPALAQSLRYEAYVSETKEGSAYLYLLEYEKAFQFFTELEQRHPEHPGPPLAQAVSLWLRELFARQELNLDHFLSPGYFGKDSGREMPAADRQAYFDLISRSRELAERHLERYPGNMDARYYMGAVEGALGSFALTIDRSYLRALKHGKKAYQYQKAIIEEDPEFADSYLAVGTYEYVLDNLPWYIKWIARMAGYRGNEERGFEYLILAATQGKLVYNEARILLMILYMREEEYEYSYQVASQLHDLYPDNFLFHLNQAQILEKLGRQDQAAEAYLEVVRLAEEGHKTYQTIPLQTFRYTMGNKLLELGHPEQALLLFKAATSDPKTPSREKVLSHVKAGGILVLQGKREEATTHYEQVERLEEFEDSHKAAREFLDKPSHQ